MFTVNYKMIQFKTFFKDKLMMLQQIDGRLPSHIKQYICKYQHFKPLPSVSHIMLVLEVGPFDLIL